MNKKDLAIPGDSNVRVVLIEDHDVYSETVSEELNDSGRYLCEDRFKCMEDVFAGIDTATVPEPDLVLLDLGLPGMGGIEGIEKLLAAWPRTRILVLTAFTDRRKVFSALKAGASGYLIKTGSSRRVLNMIDEAWNGGTLLDPQIAGMILAAFQRVIPVPKNIRLSAQETRVLQRIAEGQTKKEVAIELALSYNTVDQYLRRIFTKLHVHSLPAAVGVAIRCGLLDD